MDSTVWPVLALIAGIVYVLAAIAVIVTARAWPSASRKYQTVRLEAADEHETDSSLAAAEASATPDTDAAADSDATGGPDATTTRDAAIDSWDELSRGDDPTATDR